MLEPPNVKGILGLPGHVEYSECMNSFFSFLFLGSVGVLAKIALMCFVYSSEAIGVRAQVVRIRLHQLQLLWNLKRSGAPGGSLEARVNSIGSNHRCVETRGWRWLH